LQENHDINESEEETFERTFMIWQENRDDDESEEEEE
jgi:hypothetical protein